MSFAPLSVGQGQQSPYCPFWCTKESYFNIQIVAIPHREFVLLSSCICVPVAGMILTNEEL